MNLLQKFKETASSVLPVMAIVLILGVTAAPLGSGRIAYFSRNRFHALFRIMHAEVCGRCEERFRIRMGRGREYIVRRSFFHELSQIHDGDIVRKIFDDGEIVRDKDVRQSQIFLQLFQELH